ncbi:hypothetical protein GALMADRAFT_215105 [Galerina marginata CBS 339.88]|uniref:Uncharacterized protein n=1 Tax=Galerina marginata (strain CBS 339.88) TaxID=685588 RepID=A0A067SER3_GALM3|nr:hypothetical protein GALMADRAFT_215105 [Galerina marginata CBS 339.88]
MASSNIDVEYSADTHLRFAPFNPTRWHNVQRWHPKITPYRLAIILTTLSLGTAKAVLTQQGRNLLSITLEWITGVAVVLTFQIFSDYDLEARAPKSISWFFSYDCMDVIWVFLTRLSICRRRPVYISTERRTLPSVNSMHPPITLYRILLNVTVLFFGVSKATLAYLGYSTEVTWLDWISATFLTTGFYVIGLYEYNSSNIFAALFVQDREVIGNPMFIFLVLAFLIFCIFYLAHLLWSEPFNVETGLSQLALFMDVPCVAIFMPAGGNYTIRLSYGEDAVYLVIILTAKDRMEYP